MMALFREIICMRIRLGLCVVIFSLAASAAQAGWFDVWGNDTGGIISWSPAIRYTYRDLAADHCAHYNKVAHITSVHPWYGDYVGFVCAFPRHYDPVKAWYYGPPAHY
jgi:hypothetical protein